MEKRTIDITEPLARLSAATIFELRGGWRRLHRAPPPMRLSRDLLMRAITYKLQERPLGSLSKSILCKLECQNIGSREQYEKAPTADHVEARHTACARMARGQLLGSRSCRRV